MMRARRDVRVGSWRLAAALLPGLVASCASTPAPFPPEAPLARDPDRRPFRANPEPFYSAGYWDRLDSSVFRPVSRGLSVRRGGEAINANALDEVADSSWFQNRIGKSPMSTEALVRGPCEAPLLDASGPWTVKSGKAEGRSRGFLIEAPDGQRYMLKFDAPLQAPRSSTADVVVSRLYHAAGYNVPCNVVVNFERGILTLAKDAHVETTTGKEEPMTWTHVDQVLSFAKPSADGRYRALASRYLSGRPLGPWRYVGTRPDDRNDVVPHERRRELRGARLLGAWTAHWDHRDQNSLAMWIETSEGMGYVRHHLIDFGDSFGGFGRQPPQTIWRRNHAHWFGPGQILTDFMTLGALERPWDRPRLGPTGTVLGFYDVEQFVPEKWRPIYANLAFQLMTERDAAWMARIIARFDTEQLDALVRVADIEPALRAELVRILAGRRLKILVRYLEHLSPLADPVLVTGDGESSLCVTDLGVKTGVATTPRSYASRAWRGVRGRPISPPAITTRKPGELCVELPRARASASDPSYYVIELSTQRASERPYPARFHLYHFGGQEYLLAGLERPERPARSE